MPCVICATLPINKDWISGYTTKTPTNITTKNGMLSWRVWGNANQIAFVDV